MKKKHIYYITMNTIINKSKKESGCHVKNDAVGKDT